MLKPEYNIDIGQRKSKTKNIFLKRLTEKNKKHKYKKVRKTHKKTKYLKGG